MGQIAIDYGLSRRALGLAAAAAASRFLKEACC